MNDKTELPLYDNNRQMLRKQRRESLGKLAGFGWPLTVVLIVTAYASSLLQLV